MGHDNGGRITVEVDEELSALVPEFLDKRHTDCQLVEQYLSSGDYAAIKVLGHRMKGAGGSFGFDEISRLGEVIEEACLAVDPDTIAEAVATLRSYLAAVEIVYV